MSSPPAFEQAYQSLRRGGTLVFVVPPAGKNVQLPISETLLKGITVRGSIVGTNLELKEVYARHADGRTLTRERPKLGADRTPAPSLGVAGQSPKNRSSTEAERPLSPAAAGTGVGGWRQLHP
jgi:hypothetical protein